VTAARELLTAGGTRLVTITAMPKPAQLPFDPVEQAGRLWSERWPAADTMVVVTSIMRVQQLLLARIEEVLRPLDLTFARYEALVLLTFSQRGSLPMSLMGQRLMVHPTSVTNIVDRLEAQDFIRRLAHPSDRRRTIVEITAAGRRVTEQATEAVTAMGFGLSDVPPDDLGAIYDLLRDLRARAGDFPEQDDPESWSDLFGVRPKV
jgi:DNA-binding MarR family transcriptional regulator